MAAIEPAHYLHSSVRESMLEHMFLAELARAAWRQRRFDLEVLRPEVDRAGYDLVLESSGIFRHVQLKSMHREGRRDSVNVGHGSRQSRRDASYGSCSIPRPSRSAPSCGLAAVRTSRCRRGSTLVRHTKGDGLGYKSEWPAQREVPRSRFAKLATIDEVIGALFGAQ